MIKTLDIEKAESISAVAALIAKCEKCPLHKTKTKDVPGVGNEKARVFFIGEAPGKEEDLRGEPFVGKAGMFLTEMIEGIGYKREDVFIANVLKHRPPKNRDPELAEIEACFPYLSRQIELVNPDLIVFLGRHALNRFFPSLKISEVHSQAFRKKLNDKPQVFLALYHPAAALYNSGMRETLISDFSKIPKLLEKIDKEKELNKKEIQQKLIN